MHFYIVNQFSKSSHEIHRSSPQAPKKLVIIKFSLIQRQRLIHAIYAHNDGAYRGSIACTPCHKNKSF